MDNDTLTGTVENTINNDTLTATALEKAVEYGKALCKPLEQKLTQDDYGKVWIMDGEIEPVDTFIPKRPDRKRIEITFQDIKSFIDYVNEHKSDHTRVFASVLEDPYAFIAYIDYHETGSEGLPDMMTHKAALLLKTTDEWDLWVEKDRKSQQQLDFADFINQNRMDIIEPDGATIIEIAMTLETTNGGRCKSKTNLHNGSVHLEFVEDINARAGQDGSIEIPKQLRLSLSPFVGVDPAEIDADFQFRTRDGKLTFSYILQRPQRLIKATVDNAVERIKKEVGLPVFHGFVNK